jgi:hypothetical protein
MEIVTMTRRFSRRFFFAGLTLFSAGCDPIANTEYVLRVLDVETDQPAEGVCVSVATTTLPVDFFLDQGTTDGDGLVKTVVTGVALLGDESPQYLLRTRLTEDLGMQEVLEFIAEPGVVFRGEKYAIEVVSGRVRVFSLEFLGHRCN